MRLRVVSVAVLAVLVGFIGAQAYAAASGKHVVLAGDGEPEREDSTADTPVSISSSF